MPPSRTDGTDGIDDIDGASHAASNRREVATARSRPPGPVLFLNCAGREVPHGHEIATKEALAQAIARLLGRPYGGERAGAALPASAEARFFVPSDTLTSADATRLGIRGGEDLFGGVVPHPFIATKVVTHRLLHPQAGAPAGWQAAFGEQVADVVLPGYTAFDPADARAAGELLLRSGTMRIKRPDGVGGRGQTVVREQRQLEEALDEIGDARLAEEGLVLEMNLLDVRTFSVGQCRLAGMVVSYCGTQMLTRANDGRQVYGGSELLFARGGWDDLLALELAPQTRVAIGQARVYDDAAQRCFAGMFATRSNYDVAQGFDEAGAAHSGVLEQSWRIGGATGAELAAIGAFLADPELQSTGASTTEIYGACAEPPEDATVYFRGDDVLAGPLVKYARLHPHGRP